MTIRTAEDRCAQTRTNHSAPQPGVGLISIVRIARARARALGLGRQCMRLGRERGAGHVARDPYRLYAGARVRRYAVCVSSMVVPRRDQRN